jgi:hypothetical protein
MYLKRDGETKSQGTNGKKGGETRKEYTIDLYQWDLYPLEHSGKPDVEKLDAEMQRRHSSCSCSVITLLVVENLEGGLNPRKGLPPF